MIQRVYEQAKKCPELSDVIVATDDQRILDHVLGFGGNVQMTSPNHQTGTERCAELLDKLEIKPEVVVNIQGDEPFVEPSVISLISTAFHHPETEIATLVTQIKNAEILSNPNRMKVVTDMNGNAMYFSRSAIPFVRSHSLEQWVLQHKFLMHIGIYAYTAKILREIVTLPPTPLEQAESLEQLRWLQHGFSIKTMETTHLAISIDTPEDLLQIPKTDG